MVLFGVARSFLSPLLKYLDDQWRMNSKENIMERIIGTKKHITTKRSQAKKGRPSRYIFINAEILNDMGVTEDEASETMEYNYETKELIIRKA